MMHGPKSVNLLNFSCVRCSVAVVLLVITFIGNSGLFTMCWSLVMTLYFDDLTYSLECAADGISWVSMFLILLYDNDILYVFGTYQVFTCFVLQMNAWDI